MNFKKTCLHRKIHTAVMVATVVSLLVGCATMARIDRDFTLDSPRKTDKTLPIDEKAQDDRGKPKNEIGTNTFSLFSIPSIPVSPNKPLEDQMMKNIEATLAEAGFLVENTGYPRLACRIDKFYFTDFTWLFPLYLFGGEIGVTLSLNTEDGGVLWSRAFNAKSEYQLGFISFDGTIQVTMKKLYTDIQLALLSQDFLKNLEKISSGSAIVQTVPLLGKNITTKTNPAQVLLIQQQIQDLEKQKPNPWVAGLLGGIGCTGCIIPGTYGWGNFYSGDFVGTIALQLLGNIFTGLEYGIVAANMKYGSDASMVTAADPLFTVGMFGSMATGVVSIIWGSVSANSRSADLDRQIGELKQKQSEYLQ